MRLFFFLAGTAVLATRLSAGDFTPEEEARAKKIYVGKCAKCHKFYEPRAYTDADWRRWMIVMGNKSKLKEADAELLNRYLDGYRAGDLPPPRRR